MPGIEEDTGGVGFPNKDERQCQGGGEGGKGDFGGHEEGGGEVRQHGSFDWRFA